MELNADSAYQRLLGRIAEVYTTGRMRAHQAVNVQITETYWQIGHDIVEFEQGGKNRADYGTALLASLSGDLTLRFGKGFSRSNVIRIRQFYLAYPKGATLSHLLSWSHVVELLKIDDPLERGFYEAQAIREKWAVRELQRQKNTSLFLRLAAGIDQDAIRKLAAQGQIIAQPDDLIRDPYIFEFLKIPEPHAIWPGIVPARMAVQGDFHAAELDMHYSPVRRRCVIEKASCRADCHCAASAGFDLQKFRVNRRRIAISVGARRSLLNSRGRFKCTSVANWLSQPGPALWQRLSPCARSS